MQVLSNPTPQSIPGLFLDLNNDAVTGDDVQLTVGLMAPFPLGLRALDGDDAVIGSSDGETMFGNRGRDTLTGADGDDIMLGGRDNDRLTGDIGNDFVAGNIGQDLVEGGEGDDTLRGGQDSDVLLGGNGNDLMYGDFGADAQVGGAGSDTFVLRADNTSSGTEITIAEGDADLLIDFRPGEDRIGLTGGLTQADLIFIDVPPRSFPIPAEVQALIDEGTLAATDFDPDGDGLTQVTLIGTGFDEYLGAVLNVTSAELQGQFVAV
ncbi:MAG: calcium-binding protein [Cyanobacteriota bacterium]|nr:calcium-binding protein [Cyanobacteriota bacterium]